MVHQVFCGRYCKVIVLTSLLFQQQALYHSLMTLMNLFSSILLPAYLCVYGGIAVCLLKAVPSCKEMLPTCP